MFVITEMIYKLSLSSLPKCSFPTLPTPKEQEAYRRVSSSVSFCSSSHKSTSDGDAIMIFTSIALTASSVLGRHSESSGGEGGTCFFRVRLQPKSLETLVLYSDFQRLGVDNEYCMQAAHPKCSPFSVPFAFSVAALRGRS
eukprot:scaffold1344_cov232-Alexandrium_tamarense.AAC.3